MYKRLISLLLCLMLPVFPVSSSAMAESGDSLKGALGAALLGQADLPASGPNSRPYLALYVDYQKTDERCTTHAKATLVHINSNGSDSNPAAQDIVIELQTEDTLELRNGSGTHVFFDDLPCGDAYTFEFDLFCPFPTEHVDPVPEPKLTITVTSSNVGRCEYTCVFDSTTEPRALVWGWDVPGTTPNAIRNDLDMMSELFEKSYYNRQPVQTTSCFNHEDIWELVDQLPALETDDNDVTYIYLNAHGTTYGDDEVVVPGFLAFAPDASIMLDEEVIENENIVLYIELFPALRQQLKGRIVIVIDACYSGAAISRAERMSFEPGQLSLMTSVSEGLVSGAYDSWLTEDYGWFTKELYDEFSTRTAPQTMGDAYAYMREYADSHITLFMMDPQFTGNDETTLFCLDPNAWIDDPELVVVEETLVTAPSVEIIVTTEIEDAEDATTSHTIVRPSVTVTGRPDATNRINARLAAMYDAAQNIVAEQRQEPIDSNGSKHLYTLTVNDVSACGSLLFITFEEVRYTSGAARPMSTHFTLSFDTTTGQEAEITDILPHDGEAVNALTGLIEACLTRDHAADLFIDAHTAAAYAITEPQVTWSIDGNGVHVLYPADCITPRYLGSLDIILPFESLSGILEDARLPSFPDVQGIADISCSTGSADFGQRSACALQASGAIANVTVSLIRGDASFSYPTTVVFYATALYGQSAFLPVPPEGEWYAVCYESAGQTIERQFR